MKWHLYILSALSIIGILYALLYLADTDASSILWFMLLALYVVVILQTIFDYKQQRKMGIFRKKKSIESQNNEPDNVSSSVDINLQTKDDNPTPGNNAVENKQKDSVLEIELEHDAVKEVGFEENSQSVSDSDLIFKEIEMATQNNTSFVLYLSKKKLDLSLFFNFEDKELWSEDAHPINECNAEKGLFLLAAFDGMGGAGAQIYKLKDLSERTGAAIGAALAREVTFEFFRDRVSKAIQDDGFPKDFHLELEKTLKERFKKEIDILHENPDNKPRVFGTLTRTLPTTAAMQFVKINKDRTYIISSVWAGDSTNFILKPEQGIQQITIDDFAEPGDALYRIRQGPVLNNMVQACIRNRDYQLRRFDFDMHANQKFILLSCSDGAFDYFSNPAEFELNLLKYMLAVDNPEAWKQNLTELFKKIAQDDVTMALRAFGFSSYNELKAAFEKRYLYLKEMIEDVKSKAREEIKKQSQEAISDDEEKKRDLTINENDAAEEDSTNESTANQPDKKEEQTQEVADELPPDGNDKAGILEGKRETVDDAENKQAVYRENAEGEENDAPPELQNGDGGEKSNSESMQPLRTVDVDQRIWAKYKPGYEHFMQEIQQQIEK